jgi:hypothetical protein
VHSLERDQIGEALHALLVCRHAEVLPDREHAAGELVEVFDGADLELHQKSSGQNGGRGVRKRVVARSIAPAFTSRTRSAAARRSKLNAPR